MRIVVYSACDADDVFVIQRLHEVWSLVGVVRPSWQPKPKATQRSRWRFLKRPWQSVYGRLRNAYYSRYFARVSREIALDLFGKRTAPALEKVTDVPSWAFHERENVERLKRWQPDVLILAGCPVLRESLFSIPKLCINLHQGISSHYRGQHTLFWPLLHGDWDHIGGTIHHVDSGLDTGSGIASVYPSLDPEDTEASLRSKCARLMAKVLVEYLHVVEKPDAQPAPPAQIDCRESAVVRLRDRKLRHELRWKLRRLFGTQPPHREERIERWF